MNGDKISDSSSAPYGAVRRLVVFVIDEQRYALPLGAVLRVLPMVALAPLPQAPPITLGVFNLRGTVIPVLDIRGRFGCDPRDYGVSAHLLVARTARRSVALPADEVLGVHEVAAGAVTPVRAVLPGIGYIAGIVALEDGLLFIQDLDAFLFPDEEECLTEALEGHAAL